MPWLGTIDRHLFPSLIQGIIILRVQWTIIQLLGFTHLWNAHRLTDDDLAALEAEIMENPGGPPVMRGTGGLRKIRFAPPSFRRGKSGAMRVGFTHFPRQDEFTW